MQYPAAPLASEKVPAALLPPPPPEGNRRHDDASPGESDPERILAPFLAGFPHLTPERTAAEIDSVLYNMVRAFGFDWCGLLRLIEERSAAEPVRCCGADGNRDLPETVALKELFPWTRQNLLSGNIVCFSSTEQLPHPATVDRQHFEAAGIQGYLAVPIYSGRSVEFLLVAKLVRPQHLWRKEEISLVRLMGELFVMALERGGQKEPDLRLERLISEVSAKLLDAAGEDVDREIAAALEEVRTITCSDRCALLAFSPDSRELGLLYSCCGDGMAPPPEKMELALRFPWTFERLMLGEAVHFAAADDLAGEAAVDRASWQSLGVKAAVALPVRVAGAPGYLLVLSQLRAPWRIQSHLLPPLRLLGELMANALVRMKSEEARREALAQVQRMEELHSEGDNLQLQMICSHRHEEIVGQSAALAKTLTLTEQVAPTDSTVLIFGETGTGKELVAKAIHKLSTRRTRPMVKVNCASLPAALVESELFGREKGAYTGALTRQAGRFELADGGTIFLDEIAEMSLELQAKLLRVLQEGQFERLGSPRTTQVDVRVVAATNRDLAEEVRKGNFREDLFYRLNVFRIVVPPLRQRTEDIPLLVWSFINEFGEKMGKKINRISKQDMDLLQRYPWPGNVRELRNVVEHAVIISSGDKLQIRLPEMGLQEKTAIKTLQEYEIMHITEALRFTRWRIKGEGGAASLLGLNPSTLYSRMQKLGISHRPAEDGISP